MNTINPVSCHFRLLGLGVLLSLFANSVQSGATSLATEPFTSTSRINSLPNVVFVLDDSGSMDLDYLPDWAGPWKNVSNVLITPSHRFFNSAYNGVAYNPATRYRPPVMYSSVGALDTTTYPSMDGTGTARGGDTSATSTSRNWRAVKKDGYGIQSTATVNIEGNAYYYTTTAGEYCTTAALRTCTAATAASGSYTFPAKLRWCTTSVKSLDTTANSNGFCQASNIADTPTNTANGVTNYTYPRIAGIRTATVTVSTSTTVTGITVGGVQIMSGSATGGSADAVATAIATQINACTYGLPTTTSCGTVGYSATVASNVVTITAPGASSATPVVTGGSTTVTAFSGNSVPGQTALTVITPSVTSYPKSTNRTDCSGSTCTYAEEMTNYANWYAYYRTRMQMMKTAASIAFSSVDDKFRVGYFTINNGSTALTGGDFLNVSAFDGSQKHAWYSMFFLAKPFGPTPLRTGLSKAGRMYAGKLSTLNGQSVTDPMQYSCQQNFTILSTDGYWNDASDPVQVDGSTAVGQQDGSDPRPYYDGATYTRTSSQTTRTDTQVGQNSFIVESQTQQLQSTTRRLTQSVVTTTTYPYQLETSQLRTQTTPLNQTTRNLESRSYNLRSSAQQLRKTEYKLDSTPRILNSYINNLTKTSTPLQQKTFNITSVETPLQQKVFNITKTSTPLQQKTFNITSVETPLQQKVFNITKTSTPLQQKTFNITSVETPLQQKVFKLTKSTRQLQKRQMVSTDGGDTWQDTGWVDATSCTVTTTGVVTVSGSTQTKNTTCQYATAVALSGQATCSTVAASTSPNYTVAQSVSCAYETTPTTTDVTSCSAVAQSSSSPYSQYTTCTYTGTPVTNTSATTCSAVSQSTSNPYAGPARTCTQNTTPVSTTDVTTCNVVNPSPAGSAQKVTCTYTGTPTTTPNLTACTTVAASTSNPYSGPQVSCAHETTAASTTNVTSCTASTPNPASSVKTTCTYTGTPVTNANATTCSAVSQSTSNPYAGPARTCTQNTTPVSTTDVTTCNAVNPSPAGSAQKVTCTYTGTPTTTPNLTACTTVAASTSNPYSGPQVSCAHETTAASTTNVTSCTASTPNPASSVKTTCTYTGTPVTNANATTCSAVSQSTSNPYAGPARTCTQNTTPVSTTDVTTCNVVNPSPAGSAQKVTCTYTGTPTTSTVSSCTAVAQSTSNPYSGPAVTCAYAAAVLQASNLTTCTAGTASTGPTYNAYTTCGYTNGTTTSGLNSCTYVADSTGPTYSGPANACAYATTGTTTDVTSCTWAAQSPTFAAPQVSCAYAAAVVSTVTSCSNVPQSTGTTSGTIWSGPAVSCAYSTTASSTNTNATSCTANRQTASPFTGPAVDCTYAATTSTSNNVSSCTAVAQSTTSPYVGPSVSCAYGSPGAWSDVTSGSCTVQTQSAGPAYVGPARSCAYNTPVVTLSDNSCTNVPQSTGPVYSVLQAKNCVAGAFPVVGAAVVSTVDTCSTSPTSVTNPTTGVNVGTATTCTYQSPVTANTGTCSAVPASGSSPYVTSVSCASPIGSWTPVAPSCSLIGTVDAATPTFNSSGTAVNCRKTDTVGVTSTADYNTFSLVTTPPVAACTAGTNTTTKEQTRCTTLLSTGPDPVETCTPADPPVAPDYVKTVCTPVVSTATSMGCAPQTATAPLWQTVTCTYNAGSGTENTLADVAAYYYKTDLRTSALNNCVGAPVAPATTGSDVCLNNVPTSSSDPNTSQHMTTFTLGLGASGYMKYSDTYPTDTSGDFYTVKGVSPYAPENGITADPSNGVCSWQSSGNCNWPFPSSNEQTTIDDLWHAGVNGRGAYFSATDPVSLANSISSALSGVAAAGGAAAAPALSTPSLVPADSYVFSSTFTTSDWTGEVARRQIDPFTGSVSPTNDWAVQAKLDAKSASTRNIYVFDNSVASTKLKAFTSANYSTNTYFNTPHISMAPNGLTQFLCASTDICLSSTDQDSSHASGANLVEYLRGVRTNEGAERDNAKYYRARQHVLGDLVNAQVVYVTKPKYEYSDPGYTAFVSAQSSRQAVAYAGANDGMLHAFAAKGSTATEALVEAAATANAKAYLDPSNASLAAAAATATTAANAAVAADTVVGQELWAFIPATVLPNLYKLADKRYRDKHRPYVDATPVVGDVCISDCAATTAVWKTILVGGLGRGGRGYYALDITDPVSPKALWEFTDANLGYTFGNPEITKLADGTWVVMFASGYNNIPNDDGTGGDGVGRLYVLNAYSGTQVSGVSPISTGVGGTSSPSGLVKITAQVVNPRSDNTTEAVYGGDLLGNLWRFDVNDAIGANGYDAQLLATLSDGAGNAQPLTTKPEVGLIEGYNVVFVGTGRYLAASDATDTSTQTLYAIKDPRAPLTTPSSAIFTNPGGSPRVTGNSAANFIRQVMSDITCPVGNANCAAGELVRTITSNPVSFVTNNGWFVDLIGSAERANTDPALALGLLAFNTNAPSLVACDVGGKSYSYFLDYLTGGPIYGPGNNNSTRTNGVAGVMLANELASSPALAVTKGGKLIILSGLSGGGIASKTPPQPAPASVTRRTSWRELIRGN